MYLQNVGGKRSIQKKVTQLAKMVILLWISDMSSKFIRLLGLNIGNVRGIKGKHFVGFSIGFS